MASNSVPRLFEATKILPELQQSGLADAPDPADTEYASPARAGIETDDAAVAADLAEPDSRTATPPTAAEPAAPATPPTPKSPEREYAHEDDGAEAAGDGRDAASVADGDFTPELLEQANRHGWDADSARRFGSPENLQWAIAQNTLRMAEWGEKQIEAMQQQQPAAPLPPAPAAQQPAAPAPPQTPAQQQAAIKKFELQREKLIEQGYDEDTINLLTGMNDHYAQEMARITQWNEALTHAVVANQQQITNPSQVDANARQQTFERDMDAFFEGLGPEWEAEFGKGTGRALLAADPNSPALAARKKIASTVYGLEFAEAQSHQPPSATPALAQSALSALHFKKQQELALKEKAGKVQQRRSQAIARPGGSRSQPVTGKEKAYQRSQAFDRKFGTEPANT